MCVHFVFIVVSLQEVIEASKLLSFLLLFIETVALCNSPKCPGTHFVDQAGLELTEISLHLPTKC